MVGNSRPRLASSVAVISLLGAACEAPTLAECIDSIDPQLRELGLIAAEPESLELEVPPNVRFVSINVGNDKRTTRYALRLSYQTYEDFIAGRLAELQPDVVGVQEVLSRARCLEDGEPWEDDPERTCFDADEREDAVRRLLGPDYSIVCDAIESVDCVGVHVDFGTIEGLAPGGYEAAWSGTLPLPEGFDLCTFTENDCREKLAVCDAESSMMALTIETLAGPRIEAVHAHPSAFGQACREHQLADGFAALLDAQEEDPGLGIMMFGDWNLDPDRFNRPTEETLYYSHVGPGQSLHEHDERDESCVRVKTAPFGLGTLDRFVTDFARGFCSTLHDEHVPIGASEPRGRIDEEFDEWSVFPDGEDDESRIDHKTVVCDLYWDALD